jgi:hypothetical protein
VVFYGLLVLVLFVGFAQSFLAPETWFGRHMGGGLWRIGFAVVLTVVWGLLERLLQSRWQFYRPVQETYNKPLQPIARDDARSG